MPKFTPAARPSRPVRSLAVITLLSLLIPVAAIGEPDKRQKKKRIQSAPFSAPPEPFRIGTADSGLGLLASMRVEFVASLISLAAETAAKSGLAAESEPRKLEGTTSNVELPELRVELETAPAPQPEGSVDFDFDGDGKADLGRWQVSSHEFLVKNSNDSSLSTYSVGSSTAKIAPGDFNGDGNTDAAVFDAGTWTYKTSPGASAQTISLGTSGDIPVAGDYDGDGTTDAAVYRPSTYVWYIKQSSTGNTVSTTWGASGDIPVPGNYDGDDKTDIAVWRPGTGVWYVIGSDVGTFTNTWGVGATDMPVPADYDGDGITDFAVFRRSTGVWYVKTTADGFPEWMTQSWGNYGDQPVPADYDGDGRADYAIWRAKTGTWWKVHSGNGSQSIHTETLGVQGDKAVPAAYLKQVDGTVPVDDVAAARLAPRNATGGTDLYSQNFSWGSNLVSLPGRAGLDVALGIGYNSLVWTKG